jgi:hypothetical protein
MAFAVTIGLGLALLFALALAAAPAGAVVREVGGSRVGVQPRVGETYMNGRQPASYANPEGHPVLHGENTFAIYWDPTDNYHADWQQLIDGYLHHAAAASGTLDTDFSVATQYTDTSNAPAAYKQTFLGAYTDTKPYPVSGCEDPSPLLKADRIGPGSTPVCLTRAQIAAEVESFISSHALPKGMGNVYFVMTPPGATVCLDSGGPAGHCSDYEATEESQEHSFCSYHAAINPGGSPSGDPNTILYAVIPWTAGGAGDPLLQPLDRTHLGWECQDAGINPAGTHGYEVEKVEKKGEEEIAAWEALSAEQKEEAELPKLIEGPHMEQPNQASSCPTVFDGGCDTGLADLIVTQIGLEQVNTITDPLLNGWQDKGGYENTDECRFLFGLVRGGSVGGSEKSLAGGLYDQIMNGGTYYLNDVFNLAALQLPFPGADCLNHVNLVPAFTTPTPVNAGEQVGFDGMESNISLNAATAFDAKGAPTQTYAGYSWNFGDGSAPVTGFAPGAPACETPWLSPCAASVLHSYTYGGTYTVTLTVTDVGGNTAVVSHNVTVIGPPPPPPPAEPGSTGTGTGTGTAAGSSTGSGTGSGSTGGAPVSPPVPGPVAAAAVVSHSLKKAIQSGIAVRYSINEQVAGRFEILLSRSLAHRLGISGSPAVGLPTGWPTELVIGKALLVTTQGGGSTVHVVLSKATGRRLARLGKVTLLLRLVVHNAGRTPASTTVLSTFTLH